MFKEGKFRNYIVMLALVSCSQPSVIAHTHKDNLPVKVAIIDSGYDPMVGPGLRLCLDGHYDYTKRSPEIGMDTNSNSHGTKIARIVAKYSGGNYCLIIYKVFNNLTGESSDIADAVHRAHINGARIINLSMNTWNKNGVNEQERINLLVAGEYGVRIFVAAGNDSANLDKECLAYPACYKGVKMTVVGSSKDIRYINKSNYGKIVDRKEAYCDEGMCGTSVSAAIATGKTIKEMSK